ncbi:tRNA (N(6)-L-threonylcarbamoyladenosine(37)-C(2))-methylthiotransferase [Candidatus Woesearchaeota archaeon]|nr:MAG: tRNA (N(6)-L-threonylcarbamoyladenosine(37)-C(2))-methylthiotransferase [Candidatus Woesearchaeota archaeon]
MNVCIKTYGCSLNQSDSEAIAGLLVESGHCIVEEENADVFIVNTCMVKGPTETKVLREIKRLDRLKKSIVVAGCLPQSKHGQEKLKKFSIVGPSQIGRIIEAAEKTLNGGKVTFIDESQDTERVKYPVISKNKVISIIPINSGCLGACSFCIAKKARGNLVSYQKKDIISQIKKSVFYGAREIWLTSPDTAVYGKDIGTNIVELLEEVTGLRGGFKVRLGMGNPDYILKNLKGLINVFKHEKMFKFLHVPVQSGNDKVLREMLRPYSVSDFKKIVNLFRKEIPNITISTDIICGFPTETEEQFNDSLALVKEIKPDVLNISRFWPRPNTRAAELNQLPGSVTKERSRRLSKLFEDISLEKNKKWVGWQGNIIIDELGKNNTFIGRNFAYKQVVIKGNFNLGDEISVKITDATKNDLRAIMLDNLIL